ncbi:hypothetical protein XELAEV_18011469mg [Xenopus laevis]|uniref:Uncharacterized protein n=1 Tax=Xenopus laevis TaxID=8355 RepID=A0A974HXH1_XENLA|nr:hypothetical protein XELAEV_18011469mg [Xenopus laevis]
MENYTTSNPGLISSSLNSTTLESPSAVTWRSEEFDAAWYIVSMVGFFGFIMFSVLIINMLNPVEDDAHHLKYEEQLKKNLSSKNAQKVSMFYVNTAALLPNRTAGNKELMSNTDNRQNYLEVNPGQGEDLGLTVSTRL